MEKIKVYCFEIDISDHNSAEGEISSESENFMVFTTNTEKWDEKDGEKKHKECEGFMRTTTFDLIDSKEMDVDEAKERYYLNDNKIESILKGKDLEWEDYLCGDSFRETSLSIEKLREQRNIDSEPFNAQSIIEEIASKYKITLKRKNDLSFYLKKLETI
jgi:hypothetical protein